LPAASWSSSADSFVMEAVIVSANVDADVPSRGAFLHFDNLAFELVASAEFHGSLLSLSAGDNP
jgi:hypothetical protein